MNIITPVQDCHHVAYFNDHDNNIIILFIIIISIISSSKIAIFEQLYKCKQLLHLFSPLIIVDRAEFTLQWHCLPLMPTISTFFCLVVVLTCTIYLFFLFKDSLVLYGKTASSYFYFFNLQVFCFACFFLYKSLILHTPSIFI